MNHLTSEQRYAIYLGRKRGWSRSRIAGEIGVHPLTVSRELQRNCNSNSNGEYVWCNAQRKADMRRHGLQGNHRKPPELWWRIERMIIEEDWSPSQIAGVLRKEGINIVKCNSQDLFWHLFYYRTKNCQMFVAKLHNFLHPHNRMRFYPAQVESTIKCNIKK